MKWLTFEILIDGIKMKDFIVFQFSSLNYYNDDYYHDDCYYELPSQVIQIIKNVIK